MLYGITKRVFHIAMILLLSFGFASNALADPKALDEFMCECYQAAPLDWNDFWIKVGKTDINLLTYDVQAIVDASGRRPKEQTSHSEGVEWTDFVIKAREATFYITPGTDYCWFTALTKKGVTARGIKLGSTEKALLAAYPAPTEKDVEGKFTHYTFRIDGAPNELTPSDAENINKLRPYYFYNLYARVNAKTNKVVALFITASYSA